MTSVELTATRSHAVSLIRKTARTINDSGMEKSAVASSAFQNFGWETGAPYSCAYPLNFGRVLAIESSAQSMSSSEAA